MHLPDGMTCSDCRHFARCNAIFGHIAADEVCDWSPSRFHQKPLDFSTALAQRVPESKVGMAVRIGRHPDVSINYFGRDAAIVAGPEIHFGMKKYQVTIAKVGRETVERTVWLPAGALLVKRTEAS